jgi:hypothetical protein
MTVSQDCVVEQVFVNHFKFCFNLRRKSLSLCCNLSIRKMTVSQDCVVEQVFVNQLSFVIIGEENLLAGNKEKSSKHFKRANFVLK